ncbi:MAG: Ppx/GppA phosphatase family protein [Limnospira maxima]|uniref:Ppx/GppA Guanosine-5'-triphosphate, 3'-diphosphate diphosphatase n=1 Tax=Limnospira indica PCC 8005 TaxID=376219 RepID=A0A9P1P1X6_9CYAN|nr:Ppx/GppA phosphatase family protein [Limnospira indica]CDM98481.1 Ppx/GppA Guanosine-5'-triphosphate, 3'-diphosphate diphosphatase [Limnospira indica PCC 8005]
MTTSVPHLGKQLRPSGEHILASIDLGTNSLHMVIVRIDKSLPAFTIIAREKDTVRLGDCGPKGQLKPEVMDRAIATLKRFQELAKTFNVEQVVAVATSAVREAPNGRDFIKRVSDELDLEINLISGPEEARRIYLGVLSAMEFHDEPHVIIDIGGGSTELILGDGGEPKFLSSTKVGAVRLTQEYIKTDPISRTEFLFVQAYIRGMLERPVDELRLHLQPGKVPHLVGTSGTIETLAVMIAKEKLGTEPTPLAGYQITLNELHNIVSRLRKLSYQERLQIPGINDRRAEIILAGALILQEAMSLLEIESLTICERSLREGVIVDWMLTHGLIEDRLRYESSIRQRSILKIAQKYNVDLEHGERVAAFSLSLFDQTNGILHDYGSAERELLWAAAILHNCGLYISHSAHHKHSYYLIRNGELLGYTETEIDMIANLARYHRKSAPKKKHENYQNLSKKNRHIIDRLNPLMRLAVALDRRQIGAVAEVNCECDRDKKEFKLILKPVDPQDNCALELWSLDIKKDVFEQQYNLKLAAFLEP